MAESANGAWRNRIVSYGERPAQEFLANPGNWRIHPSLQQDALAGALDSIGWIQDVILNLRSSPEWGRDRNVETMLDGHLRITLALRRGDETLVPYKCVDLTPAEEALALATLDPLSALAVADQEKLDALVGEIQAGHPALQDMLASLVEKRTGAQGTEPTPPEEFGEVGDGIRTDYRCPSCGYEWSGKPK